MNPMLLYVDSNFASPYAMVAFISLLEKGLTFDVKALEIFAQAQNEAGFASTSITRRVPTLVHGEFALSESSAICEYIDETFAGTRLYPPDAREPSSGVGAQRPHADSRGTGHMGRVLRVQETCTIRTGDRSFTKTVRGSAAVAGRSHRPSI